MSTVNVYEWTGGNAAGHLNPTPIITGADCARSLAGDPLCAIVNSALLTPPWPTQDKDGDNILNTSEFFEGGLDLTRMGLAFGCFNKVIFDTRSSQSLTATLFDFTLGTFLTCNDGNACTADTCDPTRGCLFATIACDDGNVCTTDTCDATGGCVHTNNTAPCSDGNACTAGEVCSGGTCQPGTPRNCNDGNPCTDDSCNPTTGCVHTNNTASCDDGNACTLTIGAAAECASAASRPTATMATSARTILAARAPAASTTPTRRPATMGTPAPPTIPAATGAVSADRR